LLSTVAILNHIDGKQINHPFYIKGVPGGYDIDGKYIYVSIGSARTLSNYNDVPNNYILRINRDDLTTAILTRSGIQIYGVDLKIATVRRKNYL
jgi:hypothetical protein